jgi:hypothetical protein
VNDNFCSDTGCSIFHCSVHRSFLLQDDKQKAAWWQAGSCGRKKDFIFCAIAASLHHCEKIARQRSEPRKERRNRLSIDVLSLVNKNTLPYKQKDMPYACPFV